MSIRTLFLSIVLSLASLPLPAEAACPSSAPLSCGSWCCPYGAGSRTDVCCNDNPQSQGCTSNGVCSTTTSPPSTTPPPASVTCPSGYPVYCQATNGCCPSGYVCCPDGTCSSTGTCLTRSDTGPDGTDTCSQAAGSGSCELYACVRGSDGLAYYQLNDSVVCYCFESSCASCAKEASEAYDSCNSNTSFSCQVGRGVGPSYVVLLVVAAVLSIAVVRLRRRRQQALTR